MELYERAAQLMEAAQAAAAAGGSEAGWTAFISGEGGWQMIAGVEYDPRALVWSRGAQAVWQVRRHGPYIRVEGWAEGRRCLLEAPAPARGAGCLISDQRLYAAA